MTRPIEDTFAAQLALVASWAEPHRKDRTAEVLAQVVPPVSFLAAVIGLHPDRQPRTFELLEVGLRFTYAVAMRFKDALRVPRPVDHSPLIQPMLLTPGHGALPAGHAAESHMAATLLSRVLGLPAPSSRRTQLRRLARRIGENRVVAGLHFPIDNIAGKLLGDVLASYLCALATETEATSIDGGAFLLQPADALAEPALDADTLAQAEPGCTAIGGVSLQADLPCLRALFESATKEW